MRWMFLKKKKHMTWTMNVYNPILLPSAGSAPRFLSSRYIWESAQGSQKQWTQPSAHGACGGRSRSRGSGAGTTPRAAARSRSHQPYHRLHIYNRSLSRDDTRWAHKTSIIDLHQLYLAKQTYMWIPCPRSLPPGRMRHTGRRTPGSLYERWLPR